MSAPYPIPCNFCGTISISYSHYRARKQVQCSGCGAMGPLSKTEEKALEAWNTLSDLVPDLSTYDGALAVLARWLPSWAREIKQGGTGEVLVRYAPAHPWYPVRVILPLNEPGWGEDSIRQIIDAGTPNARVVAPQKGSG